MKKNPLMQECLKNILPEAKAEIDFSIHVSKRLLDIMEEKGLTQRDLARILGKSETEISRWMQGFHNFTLKTICRIEAKLDVRIIEIAGKNSEESVYKPLVINKYVTVREKESTFNSVLGANISVFHVNSIGNC